MPNNLSHQGFDFNHLTYETIGACIDVQRQPGKHCSEIDYQRALALALLSRNIPFAREVKIPIVFEGVVVTNRRVDFVIGEGEAAFLLELKARSEILPENIEESLLYLIQAKFPLCLLINFGQKPSRDPPVRKRLPTAINRIKGCNHSLHRIIRPH